MQRLKPNIEVRLVRQPSGTYFFRVPKSIVDLFGLRHGDVFEVEIYTHSNELLGIIYTKVKGGAKTSGRKNR